MSERVTVPHVDDMPWEHFYQHMNKRHLPLTIPAVKGVGERPMPPYRVLDHGGSGAGDVSVAFHQHLHRTTEQNHDHKAVR